MKGSEQGRRLKKYSARTSTSRFAEVVKFLNKKKIVVLLLLSLVLRLAYLLLSYHRVWWDSGVNIHMGKFLFSGGMYGLWEPFRPIIWPLILGFVWKIGLNPVSTGRLIEVMTSVGVVFLTYLIGKKLFNKKTGFLAALIIAFTQTFFFFSVRLYTGIVSTFFALVGVLFFVKNRNKKTDMLSINMFMAGFFAGLSFLARFPQGLVLLSMSLSIFLIKKNVLKKLLFLLIGFLLPVVPYLIYNYLVYHDVFFPFTLALYVIKNAGYWIFDREWYYYFFGLVSESVLFVFSLFGLYFYKNKSLHKNAVIVPILFLLFFVYFSSLAHKEMRYIIVFLPYLALLSSHGLITFFRRNIKIMYALIIVSLVASSFAIIERIEKENDLFVMDVEKGFYAFLDNKNVRGIVLTSNPVIGVRGSYPVRMVFYPVFNMSTIKNTTELLIKNKRAMIDVIIDNLDRVEYIVINTCDLPCPTGSKGDVCRENNEDLLSIGMNNFPLSYHKKFDSCDYYVFGPEPKE